MAKGSLSFHFNGEIAVASNWSISLSGTQTPRLQNLGLQEQKEKIFLQGH